MINRVLVWVVVIVMVAVATTALTLIAFETKVSYGYQQVKTAHRPKGRHRRTKDSWSDYPH